MRWSACLVCRKSSFRPGTGLPATNQNKLGSKLIAKTVATYQVFKTVDKYA